MAYSYRISGDGKLVINGKAIDITDLLFRGSDNILDIDGNGILSDAVLATTADITSIGNKIATNNNTLITKVDKSYVDSVAALKADTAGSILKTDLNAIRSLTPTVNGPSTCTEGDTLTYTITDFDNNNTYEIYTNIGTVTYTGGDTFTIDVALVNGDITGYVDVIASEPSKVKSYAYRIDVTVYDIPYSVDQLVIDADYDLNAEYNDGYII